jgi:metal-responsive CopG/Arc/MetJ family transcriptional regulator
MSTISLRLPENILKETDMHAKELKMSRASYVRAALETMNEGINAKGRRQRLKEASLRVRGESLSVSKEFEKIEHDIED